ncbi:UDP-glucuronosyl/UDP-glucosyltransferase [Cynara cardunculus var. scolymus]|uniref:UDP-glucuronosyl/UDP-glucosyltransferase n=1 Tax=Cynara cardunculus var. scolymus TaxID=59895 RepID=A0A103XPP7_CYNCS|nr:UDP-glucuronosyl/UDP-glucosyltransferase [Cynara cardunculus var. scolymus]
MTPMLQLGSVLHSKGFSITMVHTKLNSPDPSNHPEFEFLPLFDNFLAIDASANFTTFLEALNDNCKMQLQDHLAQKIREGRDDEMITIIHDNIMYFAEEVANNLNLPSIVLRSSSASYELVPELHPLRYKDLPFNRTSTEVATEMLALSERIRTPSAIIWNTMEYLEYSALTQLRQRYQVPIFAVGPLSKMVRCPSTSFLKEDTNCISWLDKQAPRSVIYVSLGSLATMDKTELAETAWGLANSNQPFLWVVRPGSVCGSVWIEFFPEGFTEEIRGRGLVLKWAPQKQVLAHSAVGGFWSHCGWNSTLESISEGIPMICRPVMGDQCVNSRYLSSVWRIGLELEHLERKVIESAIRRLLVDDEGKEMRQRAIHMKEKAKHSLCNGGSSFKFLNDLVEFLLIQTRL